MREWNQQSDLGSEAESTLVIDQCVLSCSSLRYIEMGKSIPPAEKERNEMKLKTALRPPVSGALYSCLGFLGILARSWHFTENENENDTSLIWTCSPAKLPFRSDARQFVLYCPVTPVHLLQQAEHFPFATAHCTP